jgi:LPXTG-motif cell wall-anchored protein
VSSAPTGARLPFTGSNALPVLVAGLLLVGLGAVAMRAARRRS